MGARVTLVADGGVAEALAPLVAAWRNEGTVRLVSGPVGRDLLVDLAGDADAMLVVGDRRRAPRTVLPGPTVAATDGRTVPVGWLPATGLPALARFATAAARVHARREAAPVSAAVLGQRHRRFGELAERTGRALAAVPGVGCRTLTAYDVHRDDLVRTLSLGPAVTVYVGHGRPLGWVGYAGLRARHWGPALIPQWQPGAVVLSLTCRTASRRRTGLSFAESIPLDGVAAAALGAVGPTLHTANARWAVRLAHALPHVRTVGELVAAVAPPGDPESVRYRLLGDPTAPLRDAPAWVAADSHTEVPDVAHR